MAALGSWLGRGQKGAADFFLGGRSLPWWAVLLSIVATETSTVTFLSVPGKSYEAGGDLVFVQIALGYIVGRLVVVWLILPLYFQNKIFTAYEVLGHRIGPVVRKAASALFVVTRTLADGLRLYLTALVLRNVINVDFNVCVLVIGAATIAYTMFGGMRSVVWNDCIQFIVYMLGALVVGSALLNKIPDGFSGYLEFAEVQKKFHWLDFGTTFSAPKITFWSGVIGGGFLSLATHGVDQLTVQRYLAARTQREASWALALSGLVVLLQFALFLLIGVGLSAFYAINPSEAPDRPDEALIKFVVDHVGLGLVGII